MSNSDRLTKFWGDSPAFTGIDAYLRKHIYLSYILETSQPIRVTFHFRKADINELPDGMVIWSDEEEGKQLTAQLLTRVFSGRALEDGIKKGDAVVLVIREE
jgi:hypothetical protein